MITENDFLLVVDAFAKAEGIKDATVSTRLFNDGKKISSIRAGGSITLQRVNDAMSFMSNNWPDGATWPESVSRPAIHSDEAA